MDQPAARLAEFVDYVRKHLTGDEKGEAHLFCKRLFQAFVYWWGLVPDRPQYVILCNFDEFWIYDLNIQIDEPMDRVTLDELPKRYTALNCLFPEERKPQFNNDRVFVT